MYVQLYLFTILYSRWIATNMVKYLPYIVLFVYNHLCIHSCVGKNGANYCIKELCDLSLEIQGPFHSCCQIKKRKIQPGQYIVYSSADREYLFY